MRRKTETDPLIQRLRQLAQASPELAAKTHSYEKTLTLLRDADLQAALVPLTSLQIEEKLRHGVPLLANMELDIDVAAARELMIKLADAEAGTIKKGLSLHIQWKKSKPDDHAALRIKTALNDNSLNVGQLLSHVAAGEHGAVSAEAEKQGLDPALLLTMAENVLKPALRAWGKQLTPLAAGVSWHKSICYVCGTPATLAELQGNDQEKHLRCSTCGADWQVRRLQCAACGNEDHKKQHYLYTGEQGGTTRVEVCDGCKGYVKVIASFSPMAVEMITIEDLATTHLDALAREQGYVRMS